MPAGDLAGPGPRAVVLAGLRPAGRHQPDVHLVHAAVVPGPPGAGSRGLLVRSRVGVFLSAFRAGRSVGGRSGAGVAGRHAPGCCTAPAAGSRAWHAAPGSCRRCCPPCSCNSASAIWPIWVVAICVTLVAAFQTAPYAGWFEHCAEVGLRATRLAVVARVLARIGSAICRLGLRRAVGRLSATRVSVPPGRARDRRRRVVGRLPCRLAMAAVGATLPSVGLPRQRRGRVALGHAHDRRFPAAVPVLPPGTRPLVQSFRQCLLAMVMPLTMAPMMPTKPWSLPHRNRFSRCVVPSSRFSGARRRRRCCAT